MTADCEYLIRLRPLPSNRPEEVRVRRGLKHLLRSEEMQCVGVEKRAIPPKPVPHGVYSRLPGKPWKLVKRVGSEQAGHDWILAEREKFSSIVELTVSPIRVEPASI